MCLRHRNGSVPFQQQDPLLAKGSLYTGNTQEPTEPTLSPVHDIKPAQALPCTTGSPENSPRRIKLGEMGDCLDLYINLLFKYLLSLDQNKRVKENSDN